ncbi:MAG: GTPase HflX [Treponema sp.]|nr:GTPase HflX [Treponema sp.]
MIELEQEQNRKVRCFLISEAGLLLTELKGLVTTLGMEVAGTYYLSKREIHPAYGMGSGKASELCAHAKTVDSDCIIMDFELDPTKQRNWEKLAGLPVFDRQEVILRIFAQRAQTKEAVLQVELARLEYSLPRLSHIYGDLARQRGGSYGTKGSGETQLELDRRQTRAKIQELRKELEKVVLNRSTMRKRRERSGVANIALAGYTNAGKSSLLNALTGGQAFVENKLFATLDPLTRKVYLPNPDPNSYGKEVLLTDTVGFISNLPHSLVNAFKSTLEEAAFADLLLIVLDSGDPNVLNHYQTIKDVLKEIGADDKKHIIVLNKSDTLAMEGDQEQISVLRETLRAEETEESYEFTQALLQSKFPEGIKISAKTGYGLDALKNAIFNKLF